METIVWLKDIRKEDIAIAGGKGANLEELYSTNLPVPPAFIVTAEAYREFLEETGLTGKLIFCGVNHKTDFSKQGELLEDKIFFVFKATNLKGSFVEQFQGGKNIWLSLAQIKKLDKLFPDVLDKIKLLEGKREFFSEKQYFVDEF